MLNAQEIMLREVAKNEWAVQIKNDTEFCCWKSAYSNFKSLKST